jgi:hypothetical protein
MKWTSADEVRAVAPKLHAASFGEPLERDLFTNAPEQLIGDSGHRSPPSGRNAVFVRGCQERRSREIGV